MKHVRFSAQAVIPSSVEVQSAGSPGTRGTHTLHEGRIAFNGTAITFHSDLAGNRFEANRFDGNHADVVVEGGGAARRAVWRANAWDAYVGFDRDGDGVGCE